MISPKGQNNNNSACRFILYAIITRTLDCRETFWVKDASFSSKQTSKRHILSKQKNAFGKMLPNPSRAVHK